MEVSDAMEGSLCSSEEMDRAEVFNKFNLRFVLLDFTNLNCIYVHGLKIVLVWKLNNGFQHELCRG